MSDYRWLDDDDDDEDDDRPNALQQARRAAKGSSKRAKELEDENKTLKSLLREHAVRDAIKEKGINPKIAKLVPKDLDLDDIPDFIAELADVFPDTVTASGASGEETPAQETAPDPNLEALQRVQTGSPGASAPTGDLSQLLAAINGAQNAEELNLLLHGNKQGPALY